MKQILSLVVAFGVFGLIPKAQAKVLITSAIEINIDQIKSVTANCIDEAPTLQLTVEGADGKTFTTISVETGYGLPGLICQGALNGDHNRFNQILNQLKNDGHHKLKIDPSLDGVNQFQWGDYYAVSPNNQ